MAEEELQDEPLLLFIGEAMKLGAVEEELQCTNIYTVSTGFATENAVASCIGVREFVEGVSLTFVARVLWRRAENTRRGVDRNALTGSPPKGGLPPVGNDSHGWFFKETTRRLVGRTEEQKNMKKGLGKHSRCTSSTRDGLRRTRRVREVLGDARINMP
jgi:hypothetical protein